MRSWLSGMGSAAASVGECRSPATPGASGADKVENNGVRVVLVEDASPFARDLVAQELGVLMLVKRGMRVLTAAAPVSRSGLCCRACAAAPST